MLLVSRGYVEKTAAQICEMQGDSVAAKKYYADAAHYFRAALQIDPHSAGALNGQANIYLVYRDFRKAATIGRVVVSLSPDYTAAYWDLGIALSHLLQDKPDKTLVEELAEVYEKLVDLIPNEPSGFTPADLTHAQQSARRYRQVAVKLSAGSASGKLGRKRNEKD